MTSRDKAIEFKIGDRVWEKVNCKVVTLKAIVRSDTVTNFWIIEEDDYHWREDWFEEIPYYVQELLSKPTLDDAIAVVEEYIDRYEDLHDVVLLTQVLSALKGLKEGK